MLRNRRVGRLGLAALAVSAVLGCSSSTPTPSVPSLASVAPSEVPSTAPQTVASQSVAPPSAAPESAAPESVAPQSAAPQSQAPSSAPSPAPSSEPSPSATPGPLIVDWQRVSNPGLGSANEIAGSAAAGGHFVVVGARTDDEGVVWTSSNGRDWSEPTLPSVPGGYLQLFDVSGVGKGFIAVGDTSDDQGNTTAVALYSPDGTTWEQFNNADLSGWTYDQVAVVGSTIVLAASSNTGSGFVTSTDSGQTWSQPDDSSGPAKAGVLELTATDTDFWAFTSTTSGPAAIQVWRSSDGSSWTSVGTIPDSAAAVNGRIEVADGPAGWVLAAPANGNHKKDYVWTSADGATWQAVDPPPFGIQDMFGDTAGYIAVGLWYPNGTGCDTDSAQAEGVTFTSTDALHWRLMPYDGWMGMFIQQLRRYGRTLIGIGLDFNSVDAGTGAVWTAKLPDTAQDPGPEPSFPPPPGGGCHTG